MSNTSWVRKGTVIFIFVVLISIVAWDFLAYSAADNSSISVVVADFYYAHPFSSMVVLFLIGAVTSHLLVPAKGTKDT